MNCSNEYKEQVEQKKRDQHSVVHPLSVRNEPNLFVHPDTIIQLIFESEQIEWKRRLDSPFPLTTDMREQVSFYCFKNQYSSCMLSIYEK